jgi:hypothetical protein
MMQLFSMDEITSAKDKLSDALLAPSRGSRQIKALNAFREGYIRLRIQMHDPLLLGIQGVRLRSAIPLHDGPPIIHAVGVGRKFVRGERTDTIAVRVYVTRKTDQPGPDAVPTSINGIPTDVIEAPPATFIGAGPAPCTLNRTTVNRPVIGGVSTSHITGETGTLGCLCRSTQADDSPSDIFVLSNAHIYSKSGTASAGDYLIQPGSADGGTTADRIAQYHRDYPLVFGGAINEVDAAIGKLSNVPHAVEVCSIGKVNGQTPAQEDDEIAKHGRSTGYTEGTVDEELIDFVMLPNHSSSFIKFKNQIRIVPSSPYTVIALDGDSGSLVVKRTGNEAVGMLNAAAIDGSYAYANHIGRVTQLLNIALM